MTKATLPPPTYHSDRQWVELHRRAPAEWEDAVAFDHAIRDGHPRTGRRTVLQLTPAGLALRDRFRKQQRQAFEHITRDWPEHERLQFARLLKYADSTDKLGTQESP